MARLARAGVPNVIQRGNRREQLFFEDGDDQARPEPIRP